MGGPHCLHPTLPLWSYTDFNWVHSSSSVLCCIYINSESWRQGCFVWRIVLFSISLKITFKHFQLCHLLFCLCGCYCSASTIVSFSEFQGNFGTFYFLIILCCEPPRQLSRKKKDFLWAQVAEWDLSSKLRKSDSLWAAVFATNKQDKTNVEIVICGYSNQGLRGAFHNQMGKTSLLEASFLGKGGYMVEGNYFLCVLGEAASLIKIARCQCLLCRWSLSSHGPPSPQCPPCRSSSCMPQIKLILNQETS